MDTRFLWLTPAIPDNEHRQFERLVEEALRVVDFLEDEQCGLLVRVVPDHPPGSPLVATVEENRTGKLLGIVEAARSEPRIKLTSAGPTCIRPAPRGSETAAAAPLSPSAPPTANNGCASSTAPSR